MTWTTKALDRVREYVVIKHRLRDMNGNLCGVKFRGGYGVVEKGSKAYMQLRSLPLIKGQPEFPLLHLRKLPFVTRTQDIQVIYGRDIYYQYLHQLNAVVKEEQVVAKEEAKVVHVAAQGCAAKTATGELCKFEAIKGSPSGYCRKHILTDERLVEVGIEVPKRLTSKEKGEWKDRIIEKLAKL